MARFKLKRKGASKPPARRDTEAVEPRKPVNWPALFEELFDRLSGGETTAEIVANSSEEWPRDYDWPTARKLHQRIAASEELSERYTLARKAALMLHSEELLAIADNGSNDFMMRENARGGVSRVYDSEAVQRSKLRVDSRFRLLEALDPERFGKKLDLSNKDGSLSAAWTLALNAINEEMKNASTH